MTWSPKMAASLPGATALIPRIVLLSASVIAGPPVLRIVGVPIRGTPGPRPLPSEKPAESRLIGPQLVSMTTGLPSPNRLCPSRRVMLPT